MAVPGYVRRNERSIDRISEMVDKTSSTGETSYFPTTIEIRTNFCNFKCRMCSENYSSSIRAEKIKLGYNVRPLNEIDESGLDFSDDQLQSLTFINWAGGEPFMSPVHWKIMERLKQLGKTDVSMNYDTNLSFPGNTLERTKSLLQDFNNVRFSVSLDAVGSDVEYIRDGIVYDDFIANLSEMKKVIHPDPTLHDSSIPMRAKNGIILSYTATSLGIMSLPNVIQLCLEHDIGFQGRNIFINDNHFLNINVFKRDLMIEILNLSNRIASGTYLEKEVMEFTEFLLDAHKPCVIDHSLKDHLEEVRGKKGYFDSRMNGLLNE
jgi:organic radical activating enzyme